MSAYAGSRPDEMYDNPNELVAVKQLAASIRRRIEESLANIEQRLDLARVEAQRDVRLLGTEQSDETDKDPDT